MTLFTPGHGDMACKEQKNQLVINIILYKHTILLSIFVLSNKSRPLEPTLITTILTNHICTAILTIEKLL